MVIAVLAAILYHNYTIIQGSVAILINQTSFYTIFNNIIPTYFILHIEDNDVLHLTLSVRVILNLYNIFILNSHKLTLYLKMNDTFMR